ncbi:MAG: hypothetical protein JEY99_16725 [Spirochaetales bacterium]|nr:hypothetical protein [Spirochaetales bacterium]
MNKSRLILIMIFSILNLAGNPLELLTASPFEPEESLSYGEFITGLDDYLENDSSDDLEKLETLYSTLTEVSSWRITSTIETYYQKGEGDRPSASNLDRNLRYTLILEQIYKRIDEIKIRTAVLLHDSMTPLPDLSTALKTNIDKMESYNQDLKMAVETAETSFEDMIEIRNDYLKIIDLQRELIRAELRSRGPEAIILAGAGISGVSEGESFITAQAGFLYSLGLIDIGISAHSGLEGQIFGASLLLGVNIK